MKLSIFWHFLSSPHNNVLVYPQHLHSLVVVFFSTPTLQVEELVLEMHILQKQLLRICPSTIEKMLDSASPNDVILDLLIIISDLTQTSKEFYEPIEKIDKHGIAVGNNV